MVLEETLERGWAWEVLESGPGAPPGTISGQRDCQCTAIWGGPLRTRASTPEHLGGPLQSQLQEPDSPLGTWAASLTERPLQQVGGPSRKHQLGRIYCCGSSGYRRQQL